MPQILALLLCIVFVLFLLRIDRKQAPNVSIALWLPTIWMLLIASKPLGVWFGTGGEDMESGSPMDRAFLLALLCLALIILVKRKFRWSIAIKENIWMVLLVGYMLSSIFWSDMPFISFKRWVKELVAVVMTFFVLSESDPRKALQSIFRRTIYILIPFSYILINYFPEYGREYGRWSGGQMWIGVALQKNGLGRLCVFSAFFIVWGVFRRWQGNDAPVIRYQSYVEVGILFLTLWLLGGPKHTLTYSATSTVALAVGFTSFLWLFWMKKSNTLWVKAFTVIIASIIVYGIVTPFIGGLSIIDPSSTLGREETLTGRRAIWEVLVPLAMERPLFGHGIGGFWTSTIRALTSSHAHNAYS
jgi:exopolysaccharide production protein ExoQ